MYTHTKREEYFPDLRKWRKMVKNPFRQLEIESQSQRRRRRGRSRNLTSQSNALTELPTSQENKKRGGGEAAWCCTFIVSLSWLSRLTTHETKEIQKKNPGYFIQVYPVISRRFRRGRRNIMFSTRHELSCEAISRAKSIPFFLCIYFLLPRSSLLFFSPPLFSIWENLVSWWCATHHVHCIVCYFLFSHSFSFILWFFSFLFIFFSSGFRIETVANGAFVHVLPRVRWARSHCLPAVSESRTWRTKTATGK